MNREIQLLGHWSLDVSGWHRGGAGRWLGHYDVGNSAVAIVVSYGTATGVAASAVGVTTAVIATVLAGEELATAAAGVAAIAGNLAATSVATVVACGLARGRTRLCTGNHGCWSAASGSTVNYNTVAGAATVATTIEHAGEESAAAAAIAVARRATEESAAVARVAIAGAAKESAAMC